ncbi:NAD(P)-binding protein [Parvularcula sp. ZS-1/3]|uniref:NAD(P)-binding protein n=1 Tax=Parvularcula mediterranea TaxID=2732508 RepID=A0A7Y3RNK5_9PROT|nr:FAD-dependent oxidoreductase [Parvularcula mediterranea]NNU17368.1 NAD(P)-binding protein [Parvularcula mediterranea]
MPGSVVAIIGAGVAGLACGRVLSEAGFEVRIIDKGRGPGGRCSSRRTAPGRFDHGAVYFTARDEAFRGAVEGWQAAGCVAPWDGRFFKDGERHDPGEPWYVGTPGMNAFVRHEAEALSAEFGVEIGTPGEGRDGRFDLSTKGGHQVADADFVVLAVPAPQALALLPDDSGLRTGAAAASFDPCWTLLAAFNGEHDPGFDAHMKSEGPADMLVWQAGRPGREPGSRFVLHGSPSFSRENLEADPDDVSDLLLKELHTMVPGLPRLAELTMVHRWRYARVAEAAPGDFGLDLDDGFATCGDWHIAPRIEAAWLSGHRLGRKLAREL